MIIVHHLNASRSMRVLWMLEELELDYKVKFYERDENFMAPAEYKILHPLGRSPIIEDNGEIYCESGLIIQYLTKKYGRGRLAPKEETPEYYQYLYWLHYSEGTLQPDLFGALISNIIRTSKVPFFIKPVTKEISKRLFKVIAKPRIKSDIEFLITSLGKNDWFVGNELTGADIMLSYPIELITTVYDPTKYSELDASNLENYIKRIHQRPAFKKALEKSGEKEEYAKLT